LAATITSSARVINGTSAADVIVVQGAGIHSVNSGNGDDVICGSAGADIINSGQGNDTIFGKSGDDRIKSGPGNDEVDAGAGSDLVISGTGSDLINAGPGLDEIRSGAGADKISGGTGNDKLFGENGDDRLNGGAGADSLDGGPNDDLLQGGANRDEINPGSGENHCADDRSDTMIGTCTMDQRAPEIKIESIPGTVQAGSQLRLLWSVTDDTGVDLSWFKIAYNIGGQWITNWCGFPGEAALVSTTDNVQLYLGECPVPANAVNGNYSVFFSASDMFGKVEDKAGSTFQVVGGSSDSAAPVISNLASSTSTVGIGETLDITWTAEDETGVAGVINWVALNGYGFANNQGIPYVDYGSFEVVRLTGDEKNGTYRQRVTLKDFAPAGEYTIWFSARDVLGNRQFAQTEIKFLVN
jgi:Ca2+-binding RTX toxin-like protein